MNMWLIRFLLLDTRWSWCLSSCAFQISSSPGRLWLRFSSARRLQVMPCVDIFCVRVFFTFSGVNSHISQVRSRDKNSVKYWHLKFEDEEQRRLDACHMKSYFFLNQSFPNNTLYFLYFGRTKPLTSVSLSGLVVPSALVDSLTQ